MNWPGRPGWRNTRLPVMAVGIPLGPGRAESVRKVKHVRSRWARQRALIAPLATGAALITALAGCSSSDGSSSGGGDGGAGAGGGGSSASAGAVKTWSDEASLVAAAKKEGTVNVYEAPEFASFLVKGFEKAYPWAKVNATGLEPPAAAAKWATEVSAGVHNVDVGSIYITQVQQFTTQGAVAAVELPNDANVEQPLQDPKHLYHSVISFPYVLLYNTKELRGGGPADLKDLTDSKWAGKLVLDNPALGGPGGLTMAAMKQVLGSGWADWLKKLKANSPELTDSSSSSYDAVVRGDRPLCICGYHDYIGQSSDTPVKVDFYNQDSSGVVPQVIAQEVAAKAPHPAMAALWINWVLSTAGQQAVASSGRTPVVANVPGADKVSVPSNIKVASFSALGDYLADPSSYNAVYKQVFGS